MRLLIILFFMITIPACKKSESSNGGSVQGTPLALPATLKGTGCTLMAGENQYSCNVDLKVEARLDENSQKEVRLLLKLSGEPDSFCDKSYSWYPYEHNLKLTDDSISDAYYSGVREYPGNGFWYGSNHNWEFIGYELGTTLNYEVAYNSASLQGDHRFKTYLSPNDNGTFNFNFRFYAHISRIFGAIPVVFPVAGGFYDLTCSGLESVADNENIPNLDSPPSLTAEEDISGNYQGTITFEDADCSLVVNYPATVGVDLEMGSNTSIWAATMSIQSLDGACPVNVSKTYTFQVLSNKIIAGTGMVPGSAGFDYAKFNADVVNAYRSRDDAFGHGSTVFRMIRVGSTDDFEFLYDNSYNQSGTTIDDYRAEGTISKVP